jgi:ABC-type nitrate/sulfonate/bicarbonate transport system permease component
VPEVPVSAPAVGGPRARVLARWDGSRPLRLAALAVLALAGWQLAAVAVDSTAVPTLPQFVRAAGAVVGTSVYWESIGFTLLAWAAGLALAACVAIPAGLLIGSFLVADRATRVSVDVLRAVPLIIVTPLVVLLFGATTTAKVVVVFLAAIWHLLIQTIYGAREVDVVAKQTAISYHVRLRDRIRFLYVPSAAPFIATGVRLSAIVALLVTLGVELATGAEGIGLQILVQSSNARPAMAFVYFITASVLGLVITLGFRRIERATLFWHPRFR